MATDRQRIQGYIKPDVYEKFTGFKESGKLSESEALGSILAQHFGLVPSPTIDIDAISAWREDITLQLEQLNDRISKLENDNQELRELIVVTVDDPESVLEGQGITKEALAPIFDDDDPAIASSDKKEWIPHAKLAKRLGLSVSGLRVHREDGRLTNYRHRKNNKGHFEYQQID